MAEDTPSGTQPVQPPQPGQEPAYQPSQAGQQPASGQPSDAERGVQPVLDDPNRPKPEMQQTHSVQVGDRVQLNGAVFNIASKQFDWRMSGPEGGDVPLANAHMPGPSFLAEKPGTYTAKLTTDDGEVTITVNVAEADVDPNAPTTSGARTTSGTRTTSGAPTAPGALAATAPGALAATPVGASQINLSWTASTDPVGVTGYRLERCEGANCTNFTQIAMPSGTTYSDTGLVAGTSYSYRVRATNAANNLSPFSNVVSAIASA